MGSELTRRGSVQGAAALATVSDWREREKVDANRVCRRKS